ncbi:gp16 family protein [Alloalcanivorax xenomutans]|uniref:gp16 family protein n=1 Tax=Alloalcanivorax xenomutans TaxID=1094342 RepID=UPI003C608FA2
MSDLRRRELAKIHIGRDQLGMDDDTYRDMLWTVARVRSSSELDAWGRAKVLEHYRALGWAPKRRRHPGKVAGRNSELMRKIEAQLTDMGLAWAYADSIVRRMHQVESVRFANPSQLRDVVAALTYEQRRRADRCCPECGQPSGHAEGCPEGLS